jgi:hypothetical protein
MGHKKYYGYKPKHEHYEVVLHEVEGKVGNLLDFVYDDGQCGMNHYYWGSEMDYEYNRHGRVEHNYIWNEENTKKLMLCTGTKNGKNLVAAIYERFHTHKGSADFYIRKW